MLLIPEPRKIKKLDGVCPFDVEPTIKRHVEKLPPQGYRLTIEPDRIKIQARDAAGEQYARQTLAQIREQSEDPGMDCVRIEDWPDFAVRGYLLDISRDKVPSMDHLRRLVDALAALRYNQLQLYTEHTFAYAGHEVVWGAASPMTPEEIEALDTYCRERFIELVPNQNSFGHLERWLRHPEYQYLAECPDGFEHPAGGRRDHGGVLKPNEESLAFLGELYDELLPHFSSQKLNVGGDEPWELGQGWSAPLVEAEGKHAVYARFLRRVCELAAQHGREPLCWADILLENPEFIEELPEAAIPIIWGYEANHPFDRQCETLGSMDRPFYVAPGDSSWNSFTGRVRNMVENVRSAARHALRHRATGLIMAHWGDNGHPQTWPIAFPGLVAAAVFSWYGDADSNLDLTTQIDRLFFRDREQQAAGVLLELGDVDRLIPLKVRNHSFLCWSLSAPIPELKERLTECAAEPFEQVVSACWEWEAALNRSEIDQPDSEWLHDELLLAIGLTRFAAQRCLALQAAPEDGFALSAPLRAELTLLIGEFETVWIRRNRVGGLHESASRLRALLRR